MDILFLLIPLSVVLAFVIGAAFWLAVEGGQFDDLDGPGLSIVADDDRPDPLAVGSQPTGRAG
jgi:cbb3-type cytochrome oxidase maturation protein